MNKNLLQAIIIATLFAMNSIAHAELYWGADRIDSPKWYQIENQFSVDPTDDTSGIKFFSGYKASDFFSLELEYKDQMEFGVGDVFSGQELWNDSYNQDVDSDALFLTGQSTYNFDGGHYIYLRGGLYNLDVESNDLDLQNTNYFNGNGTDLFYSIGTYYDVTDTVGLSTAWERFEFDSEDVDFISTELKFNF
ncbi:MAG: hypothetical protein AAGB35_05880 [Pseudomonadota bacterium]